MNPVGAEGDPHVTAELKIVEDTTCTFCGCFCDDLVLEVGDGRILEAKNACVLGKARFLDYHEEERPECLIDGRPARVEDGIRLAADILLEAKYPVVYGLSDTTCEAQRTAVAIADWIGGTIDTTTSVCHGPSGMALQSVGEVTATLGEVRHRADLVIYWGSNPAESQPRHLTKYSLMPKGMWVPRGRKDRTCVVVDIRKTKTVDEADVFLQIRPRGDFEALWTLRALAKGVEVDAAGVEAATGIALDRWRDLMERMKSARYGVLFFGTGITMTRGNRLNSEALLGLTRDMNAHTRFVAKAVRGHGNLAGADNVLTWTTGFPFGVNMSRGYPRFNPGEYTTSDTLARRESDAALIVASDPLGNFSQAARDHLASIPYISLDPKETPTSRGAKVAFTVATYGINVAGTVYRMDDVSLPLRPALESAYRSDLEILSAIEARVRELRSL